MTRAFFGLLILLNIILYSEYERRHKGQNESHMRAYSRPSQISSSYSSIKTAKSIFSRMSSEGQVEVVRSCLEQSWALDVQSPDPDARMSFW